MSASSERPRPGLWDLASVELRPEQEEWLARVAPDMHGSASWKLRKQAEIRDLFALAQLAPRLEVMTVDPRTTLRAMISLRVPVPCRGEEGLCEELTIAQEAHLVLLYPEEAMRLPLPGYAFVEIVHPRAVFHPNVGGPPGSRRQHLCLGASIPAGTRWSELVIASYQALSLATYHVDPRAGGGVMSKEAADWWAANLARTPLTHESFLHGRDEEPAAHTAVGEVSP